MSPRRDKPTTDLFSPSPPPMPSRIRVGIGGWTYAPWRGGRFYPVGLVQRRELEYASRQLTSIEVNGTYYGAQKPATYAKWRDETPEGFVFSAKAPQRIMESKALSKTGHQIEDFIDGIVELGGKLGPLVWQFDKGKRIDAAEFEAFVGLLPTEQAGRKLRHVLDVRDPTFVGKDYLALARKHGMATVFTDSEEHPSFADLTADFVYARLMRSQAGIETGYPNAELGRWAERAVLWSEGGDPADLPHLETGTPAKRTRDVFLYFISSAKERNPAAAMALLERLGAIAKSGG
ncbi:DUF72 domain-containing protein [Pseudoxanthomonas sacheonensis]|uniref:Uncharacterized protein YecE (DUF72 family) n=1 Tax=Pseudoxanthomonas sacheonensis TaxID=443615 RepID=A0ABU1RV70_9GAMM|nr:DUF72 domain-containing protein [Pseudoxanthomonas sacheonensis]MDR6842487.1 uncharacterized protein YecE (DUF72 family) [Pseudoxanthomonas sacheonensis]